jgi:hypothetical protein
MAATLMWSMPLDHSGITHEVVGKNWPDQSKCIIESENPKCLRIIYFAHAYAHFMTLVCDKETRFLKRQHHIWHVSIYVHFFYNINITFNKLKMRFTWIFLNNRTTSLKLCCLRTLQWTNDRSKHRCHHANAIFNSLCNYTWLLILSLQIICKCKWNKLPIGCMGFLFPKEFVTICGLG